MGRGRAKAKQTKVARELKYHSPNTDLAALQRELAGNGKSNEEFDDTGRRTGRQRRAVLDEISDIDRVKTVDILPRIDHVEHPALGIGAHDRRQR